MGKGGGGEHITAMSTTVYTVNHIHTVVMVTVCPVCA